MHGVYVSGDRYRIDNSPFYAFDISCGDIVNVREASGRLLFDSVSERGGHSTYRVKLPSGKGHEDFLKYWPELSALGCSFEGSSVDERRLYAIDLPPEVDVQAAYDVLRANEDAGVWEFEEAHYCDRRH